MSVTMMVMIISLIIFVSNFIFIIANFASGAKSTMIGESNFEKMFSRHVIGMGIFFLSGMTCAVSAIWFLVEKFSN